MQISNIIEEAKEDYRVQKELALQLFIKSKLQDLLVDEEKCEKRLIQIADLRLAMTLEVEYNSLHKSMRYDEYMNKAQEILNNKLP